MGRLVDWGLKWPGQEWEGYVARGMLMGRRNALFMGRRGGIAEE
jgi:hypothetical protein